MTIEKTTLGTRWNWTVYPDPHGRTNVLRGDVPKLRECYGIVVDATGLDNDGRTYRVIEDCNPVTGTWHFRIDALDCGIWVALDSKKYRTASGAARAVIKHHATFRNRARAARIAAADVYWNAISRKDPRS